MHGSASWCQLFRGTNDRDRRFFSTIRDCNYDFLIHVDLLPPGFFVAGIHSRTVRSLRFEEQGYVDYSAGTDRHRFLWHDLAQYGLSDRVYAGLADVRHDLRNGTSDSILDHRESEAKVMKGMCRRNDQGEWMEQLTSITTYGIPFFVK